MRYKAIYARTETRVIEIECEAMSEAEASDKFDEMVNKAIEGELPEFDFDEMKCIDAEDCIQDIQAVV
jgi:hypothetical protein